MGVVARARAMHPHSTVLHAPPKTASQLDKDIRGESGIRSRPSGEEDTARSRWRPRDAVCADAGPTGGAEDARVQVAGRLADRVPGSEEAMAMAGLSTTVLLGPQPHHFCRLRYCHGNVSSSNSSGSKRRGKGEERERRADHRFPIRLLSGRTSAVQLGSLSTRRWMAWTASRLGGLGSPLPWESSLTMALTPSSPSCTQLSLGAQLVSMRDTLSLGCC